MLDDHIRDLLFKRLKKLGYHLIRVKIINESAKKTLQIMAERTKDRGMSLEDCTCLLYTSPSPRDVEESRMPSSA